MTTSPVPDLDSPRGVLERARELRAVADRAEAELLALAATWAGMHSVEVVPEVSPAALAWGDRPLSVAGPGAPEVAEFCVAEFASVLGTSTDSGRRYLGDAVELTHRLPAVLRLVQDGDLSTWRARRIAQATIDLPPDGAAFVDRHVAPVAHKVGPVVLERLVEEARVRFDPEEAEAKVADAAEGRHATVHLARSGVEGVVDVTAVLDLPDAADLEQALRAGAARLAEEGSTEPLDVRRARALGMLARGQVDVASGISLHLHASADPTSPLVRVEETRTFVLIDQLAAWCTDPARQLDVHPVVDLADHQHVEAYEVPDRLAERVALRDVTCAFPWCTRPARRCDCDHVVAAADGGSTCACNLVSLCRSHHRLKTHSRWRYEVVEPGTYLWTSPHGYQFLSDRGGTTDVTPNPRPPSRGCLRLVPDGPGPDG